MPFLYHGVANESGMLDDSSVPKFSLCTDGENWYKKNNRWKDKTYVPMTGNIIFFDWQQDGHTDHVGIVEKVENGKVFTIEGNSKNEVREKSYNLSSKSIYWVWSLKKFSVTNLFIVIFYNHFFIWKKLR